jgi:hypothetical protein
MCVCRKEREGGPVGKSQVSWLVVSVVDIFASTSDDIGQRELRIRIGMCKASIFFFGGGSGDTSPSQKGNASTKQTSTHTHFIRLIHNMQSTTTSDAPSPSQGTPVLSGSCSECEQPNSRPSSASSSKRTTPATTEEQDLVALLRTPCVQAVLADPTLRSIIDMETNRTQGHPHRICPSTNDRPAQATVKRDPAHLHAANEQKHPDAAGEGVDEANSSPESTQEANMMDYLKTSIALRALLCDGNLIQQLAKLTLTPETVDVSADEQTDSSVSVHQKQ